MMNWEGMGGGWGGMGWVGDWVVGWWDLDDGDERTCLLLPYLYLTRYNFRIYQFIHDARCLVCLSRLLCVCCGRAQRKRWAAEGRVRSRLGYICKYVHGFGFCIWSARDIRSWCLHSWAHIRGNHACHRFSG